MKLNIEIAKHERMASSGSSLLRSLQNENTPVLDLIVRESIQNSLDAAVPDTKFVGVDFILGEFSPALLNSYFESIGSVLTKRYSGKKCKFLAIRDTETVGLTGKLHYSEVEGQDFGNLQKLVYEISKPQTNEGAGGSWGLGKTVYFRAGIGLVIYYSRIVDEKGRYASRLAATLVEDENGPNQLIQYPPKTKIKRGIAWWGKTYSKKTDDSTCPVTDQAMINNILKVLGITPYSGTATGTTVIIPYIDEQAFLSGIIPEEEDRNPASGGYYWLNSVESYLRLAVQRWYTPRMSYRYERGPYLKAYVNGVQITEDAMAPYYKVLMQLYENTTDNKIHTFAGGSQLIDGIEYYCRPVNTHNILTRSAVGWISYAKITDRILHMTAPDNEPNPYAFVGSYDVDRSANPPLIAYIRKPGMIVNYETTGAWLDGVLPSLGGEFIVALFVLNSENEVKGYSAKSLEEYVRKGERSDHTSWFDWSFSDKQSYIVSRMKSNTAKILRQTFVQNGNGPTTLTHSGLEKALADLLLPPDGFGRGSNGSGKQRDHGGSETSHSGKSPVLKVKETAYRGKLVDLDFDFVTGKGKKDVLVELQVVTDTGSFRAVQWEKPETIGTKFPLRFVGATFHMKDETVTVDSNHTRGELPDITIKTEISDAFHIPYGFTVSYAGTSSTAMTGTVTFERASRDVLGALSVVGNGGTKE